MALIWGYAYTSFYEWATNEPEDVHFFRTTLQVAAGVGLFEALPACVQPSLAVGTVIDTRMPFKSASSGPTTISSKSTRSGTLSPRSRSLIYFETIDVLSVNRQCRKRCGAGLRVHSRAQPLRPAQTPLEQIRPRTQASEGFEVLPACASDQDGQAATTAATLEHLRYIRGARETSQGRLERSTSKPCTACTMCC